MTDQTKVTDEAIAGMREVSKEEFYALIGPRNVGPSPECEEYTDFVTLSEGRRIVGRRFPGWKLSGDPRYVKRFFLIGNKKEAQ